MYHYCRAGVASDRVRDGVRSRQRVSAEKVQREAGHLHRLLILLHARRLLRLALYGPPQWPRAVGVAAFGSLCLPFGHLGNRRAAAERTIDRIEKDQQDQKTVQKTATRMPCSAGQRGAPP